MKKIHFLILTLIINICFVYAQKTIKVYESKNDSEEYKVFNCLRILTTGYDDILGTDSKTYITQYKLLNNDYFGNQFLAIAIEHFKKAEKIFIYIVPVTTDIYGNMKKEPSYTQYYDIDVKDFQGLKYIDPGEYDSHIKGKKKAKVEISFFSGKKEHLLIHQLDSKLFNLHYIFMN